MTVQRPRHTQFWQRQSDDQTPALLAAIADEPNAAEIKELMAASYRLFMSALAADSTGSLELQAVAQAAYWASLADLANAFQGTALARFFGPHLPTWLHRTFIAERGLPAPAGLDEPQIDRLAPDSPYRVLDDGSALLDAGSVPDMGHLRQLRDYARSLAPAGRIGRPAGRKKPEGSGRRALDPVKAARAARMSDDGAVWRQIAAVAGLTFDRLDAKAANRVRGAVRRLVERGKLNRK
jgi:hypothetical protein